jgi:hypothetical protein
MLPFVLVALPAQGAELYKWVDERGVTNYSSEAPPKGRTAKKLDVGEQRLSVYTPDSQLIQAVEAERQRRGLPAAGASLTPPPPPPSQPSQLPLQQIVPQAAESSYDPCLSPGNPACSAPYVYDNSPVFYGRRRPPALVQPQLPPGTIAGNANLTSGTTPGLSGVTPPAPVAAPSPPFHLKGKAPKEELK